MLTRLATAALTLAFLAAGAFGVTQASVSESGAMANHTTVIAKNSQWPIVGHITNEPCKASICWEI